jgi:hypothetical protein
VFKRDYLDETKDNQKQKTKKSGTKSIIELGAEISKFEHYREFNLEDYKARRIKRFPIFKLSNYKSDIYMFWKFVTLKTFKQYTGLNDQNKIVGFTPQYIGFRPSQPIPKNTFIVKSILDHRELILNSSPLISDSFSKSSQEFRTVYTGGFDSNLGHLKNFFKKIPDSYTVEQLLKICSKSPWFSVPHLSTKNPTEMISCTNYNPKSGPGIFTSKIYKAINKGQTIEPSVALALDVFDLVTKVPMRNYCLWEMLAREKDNKVDDNKEEYSTRVVQNPEHYFTIISSWIMSQVQKGMEYGNPNTNLLLDKEYDGNKGGKVLDRVIEGYDYVMDIDWSSFDSTQTRSYLLAASSIIFSHYKDDHDKHLFYYLTSSLITKYISIPPGIVIELNKGLPSGHPGITIVNCVVNLIRLSVLGFEIYGDNYPNMMFPIVYGDDALIGFKYHPKLMNIEHYKNRNYFEGDDLTNKLYPTYLFKNVLEDKPDYLKRICEYTGIRWNYKKVFDKLIYQNKKRSIEDQVDLIINYVLTAPSDYEFNEILITIAKSLGDYSGIDLVSKYQLDLSKRIDKYTPNFFNSYLDHYLANMNREVGSTEVYIPTISSNILYATSKQDNNKLIFYLSNNRLFLNDLRRERNYIFASTDNKYYTIKNNRFIFKVEPTNYFVDNLRRLLI